MLPRLAALALLLVAAVGPAHADSAPSLVTGTSTDTSGDVARGCLSFGKPLDPKAHPGDFLSLQPAAHPDVQVAADRICLGGLAFGTRYTVTIAAGLPFADGTGARAAETARLDIPDRDPLVAVAGRGWILPRIGATGVTIQTVNVPAVRVRVLRVSERRLVAATPGHAAMGERPDPAKQSFTLGDLQYMTQNAATVIWSGTMQTGVGRNVTVETAFPLAGIVDPAKPGAYIVLAEDASKPAANLLHNPDEDDDQDYRVYQTQIAGHWVLSSDLGVSSLRGLDGLHVTVRSLGSAAPVPGVRLQLLSLAQDRLAEATTDAAGAVVFAPGLLRGRLAAAPAVLLATTADGDMTVQDLTAPAFDLSDRGAEGRPVPGPIEAYVYTDRGIYRRGETVQVMALLRTHGLAAVDNTGVTLLLRRPDGVEASRTTLPAQPDAGFHLAIPLSATAAQGNWTIEARIDPTLPPIGRASISVQDFVPQQLKVALTGPTAPLAPGAHVKAALDGRFLYGAPAAGLSAEGQLRLTLDPAPVADAKDYSFGIAGETIPDGEQTLALPDADDKGHVEIDAAVKVPAGIASPLRVELTAGLTEPSGRVVNDSLSLKLPTHPLLIGIRKLFGDMVEEGSTANFAIRTFAASGAPVAHAGLAWRLVEEVPHWDWWRAGNDAPWSFHYHTVDQERAHGTLDAPADRPAELARQLEWGTYRLIVRDQASGAATSVRFSVGWGSTDTAADVPDRLDVSTDHATLGIGQTARVHLRGPFAGAAQVVVESAGTVLETRAVDLPAGGTTITITATDAWGPGVHVLATAYRPLSAPARAHDPVRAVGLTWIAADPAPHTLGVAIGGPHQVTPRQTIAVPVHVTGAHGAAFVTLAAVDEGILQLTRFASPDPVAVLLGRTRLALDMRDDYGRLLEGHANAGALHEGGGADSPDDAGLPVNSTRVVALFRGPVALDANGDATIPLEIPDFAGELRLMAVAYDHDAAGHAEMALTVRDPVVADVALPRFLAPGDTAALAVSLTDTDAPSGRYRFALTASGAVALRGPAAFDAELIQGKRFAAHATLAGETIGIGHLHAVLTGPGGLDIAHDWDIAVRSPHADLVLSRTESQAPGETYAVDAGLLAPFLPGSVRLTLSYSASGAIDVPGLLQSLYTYPYGCTEQLSSAAWPLLYFGDARLLGRPASETAAVHARVQQAINTIADRQDASGRFGLWRVGDDEASVWLNVYALDFLLHARDAGFDVPAYVTPSAAVWIRRALRSDSADDAGAYAQPSAPTRAYADYVLARTNRVAPAELRALRRELSWHLPKGGHVRQVVWGKDWLASPLSVAQLAGAQSLMGEADEAAESFRLAVANLDAADVPAWWYGSFYWSRLRDLAGVLAVAAETGHGEVAAPLLERIDRAHLSPDDMNTQEKAWLLLAAHALAKQGGTRVLAVNGAAPQAMALPYALTATAAEIAHGVSVRDADDKAVFRTVTLRGAPAAAPPAVAQGYQVTRETYALDGTPLDDSHLKQTDRFIVVLSGSVEHDTFRRTVLLDMLPAGLEIEAPILNEDDYPFIGQLTQVRVHEERDDRYIAAFDLGHGRNFEVVKDDKHQPLHENEFRVAYIVRAVTPGRFTRPETVVQDLYRPDVMARTADGRVEIAPR